MLHNTGTLVFCYFKEERGSERCCDADTDDIDTDDRLPNQLMYLSSISSF